MSEFKREERFVVIKRKHLSAESRTHDSLEQELRVWLDKNLIPTSECVVVESDWPEYETVWSMLAARVEGRPTPYQALEQQIAALRQHKNDYMDAAEGTRKALEAEAQALREEVAALRKSEIVGSYTIKHMAIDITAVGEALGIPGEEQEGGTGEFIDLIIELKRDAERYRWVKQRAWYVDRAAEVYEIDHIKVAGFKEAVPVDDDDVEAAIDKAMADEALLGEGKES